MIQQTEIYSVVNRAARVLSDSVAWFQSLDPQMRRDIIDMIRYDQLFTKGIDEDGDILGLYSRATELISGGKKQEGDPYTLMDSGAFYRSIFILVNPDSFIIDGDTEKMEGEEWFLRNNLSPEKILGLTDENMQKLIDKLREKYVEYLTKILYGT